jgi:hypothetical protein
MREVIPNILTSILVNRLYDNENCNLNLKSIQLLPGGIHFIYSLFYESVSSEMRSNLFVVIFDYLMKTSSILSSQHYSKKGI